MPQEMRAVKARSEIQQFHDLYRTRQAREWLDNWRAKIDSLGRLAWEGTRGHKEVSR